MRQGSGGGGALRPQVNIGQSPIGGLGGAALGFYRFCRVKMKFLILDFCYVSSLDYAYKSNKLFIHVFDKGL